MGTTAKSTRMVQGVLLATLLLPPTVLPSDAMAQSGTFNRMIALLKQGETVFCSGVPADPLFAAEARNPIADCVFIDMEHAPYDIGSVRPFMQAMLDPAAILKRGAPGTDHPVIIRIPAYGREMNQWMAKQLLDQGVHGIRFPHIETVEQASNAVRVMRYAHQANDADLDANGVRGSGAGFAAFLWGLPTAVYQERADLWPLDPNGELISVIYIENEFGVRNIRQILQQVKGISMVHPGAGDLGRWYGDPVQTEAAVQTVLAACLEFNVPCVMTAGGDIEERVRQGFRVFYGSADALAVGRRAAGR